MFFKISSRFFLQRVVIFRRDGCELIMVKGILLVLENTPYCMLLFSIEFKNYLLFNSSIKEFFRSPKIFVVLGNIFQEMRVCVNYLYIKASFIINIKYYTCFRNFQNIYFLIPSSSYFLNFFIFFLVYSNSFPEMGVRIFTNKI